MFQRKKPAVRLFDRLVGRERAVKRIGHNEYTDVKVSSADLDPAFIQHKTKNPEHFQDSTFDPDLGKGRNPHAFAGERREKVDCPSPAQLRLNEVAQAFNGSGFTVGKMRESDTAARRKTPWWFRDQAALKEFIKHIGSGRPRNSVALDYVILEDYFLLRLSDEDIFLRYRTELQQATAGKRWTSSVNALKNRRIRLIQRGEELFGKTQIEDPHSQTKTLQTAPSETERLKMIVAGNFVATRGAEGWTRERCIQDAKEKLRQLHDVENTADTSVVAFASPLETESEVLVS
jgi:hypothetical protein